jgi:hypothetical protein
MACSISFDNLVNGQNVPLPFEVSGTITVLPTPAGGHLVAAAMQIDDNPLSNVGDNCNPNPGPLATNDISFFVDLTTANCPLMNTYYMLTIYAWDNVSAPVSLASVTFKTVDLFSPPPDPPQSAQAPSPPSPPPGP